MYKLIIIKTLYRKNMIKKTFIKFLYKYGLIGILSFCSTNFLFYIFEKIFHPSLASIITIFVVMNISIFLFFRTKVFSKNIKNYKKILTIIISFRIFEYLLFNFLYLLIMTDIKSNYIFLITLIISNIFKVIIFYKSSIKYE